MTNTEALILLVRSLTKNEKRSFRLGKKSSADYIMLFDLIDKDDLISVDQLKEEFERRGKGAVFNVTVSYLYKLLIDKLLSLRLNQDFEYELMAQILKAKVLFEKSIFPAAFEILEKVKNEAQEKEYNEALIMASRLELDYLQYLNMPDISEDELINKQYHLRKSILNLSNLYEQSSLYELLLHRTIYKGAARSTSQKNALNDLVFSEHNLARKASQSFEAQRRHLLFQSSFLMAIGDSQSAADVLSQLRTLLDTSPDKDKPLFYAVVLENMLANLRDMRRYDQIPLFIEKLQQVKHPSSYVKGHIDAIVALYNFLPLVDHGEFQKAKDFIDHSTAIRSALNEKHEQTLGSTVALYIAITYIGLKEYKKAKKTLVRAMLNKTCELPIHRILRITSLIIHHKMNDSDYIYSEARSIKREIAKTGKAYRMESLILEVVSRGSYGLMSLHKREQIWEKLKPRLDDLRKDVFEGQLLKIFDFSSWIESEVLRTSFSETLRRNLYQESR